MECLLGVCGRDFVVLASDCNAGRSIVVMKQNENKMVKLDDRVGMVVCGEAGDSASFGELVQKNIQLYKIRHGYSLSPHAAANFIRKYLADSLRRSPYFVNLLIGGYDEDEGASLYFMDYLATMAKVPFGSHGYGSFFSLSIMDKYYREDLSEQEAVELIGKCITEVQKRLVINVPEFMIHVVDKDGVRIIDTVNDMES